MQQHYTLIIIDDENQVIEYVKRLIASRLGISITIESAGTLRAGIAMCQTRDHHPYDLIILDLNLPDAKELNGLEKLLSRFPEIPIIVLTGHYEEEQAAKALEIGAQGYFEKPIRDGDLFYDLIKDAVSRNRWIQHIRFQVIELQKENIHLREEITQSKATIAALEDKSKDRKIDVDKQFKRLNWSVLGAGILALIGMADKLVELVSKFIALF